MTKKIIIMYILGLLIFIKFSSSEAVENKVNNIDGVGALGRIEPRSRVVRISHNAGAEGVNLKEILVQEGGQVVKGDILAILADHEKKEADLEAGRANITVLSAKLASEKINLIFAEKELHRYESLAVNSLASLSLMDSKSLAYKQSQAKIKEIQAEIAIAKANLKVFEAELKNTIIVAPISGVILKIHAWPGERLGDDGLLDIADLSQLDVVAEIYETDFPKVKVGQEVDIVIPGINSKYSAVVRELGYQVRKNDLNSTDPLADRDNRIIEVRLTLDNKAIADLRHQIYRQVQVRIKM